MICYRIKFILYTDNMKKDWEYIKGQTFNYLTIIEDWIIKTNKDKVLVKCCCWKEKRIVLNNIISWWVKSCWCKKSEIISNTNTKHWMWSLHWIYNIFRWMKARCENKNSKDYNRYWERWIKCLWQSFEEFYRDMWKSYEEHCDKFWKKNTTIDRIDNNWNYCKENCRRATRKVQANNRRDNHIIFYYWKKYTITELSKIIWKDHSYIKRELDKWLNIYDIAKKGRKWHIIQ